MIFQQLLNRLNQRYQENPMTCKTPCAKCTCVKSVSPYDSDYSEIDPSPLATQQRKWLASPASFYFRDCAANPSAAHCRIEG